MCFFLLWLIVYLLQVRNGDRNVLSDPKWLYIIRYRYGRQITVNQDWWLWMFHQLLCVCEHLTHYSFSLVSHLQVLQNLSFLWSPPAPQQPFTKNYQRLQVVSTTDWLPPFIHINTLTHTWSSAEVGQLVCEAWRSVSGTASSRRPGRARSSRTAGRWARRDPFSRRMTRGWREWSRGKREAGTARGCGCMILCRMATERWMTKIQKGAGAQVALCPL